MTERGVKTGTFRTLPAEDTPPESVRFAVVTYQDYLYGNFGTYHHIAESDLDFILDLGDFIYEYAERRPGSRTYPGRDIEFPSGGEKATTLKDYRYLYQKYHSNPHLQRALERHTRIFTWDDHEFANDVYWDDGVPRAPYLREKHHQEQRRAATCQGISNGLATTVRVN